MNYKLKLLDLAQKVSGNAYAPYSKFNVGAAILTDKENYYCGCNVENISYPLGTCAEEAAIASMVANGEKSIKEILIFANCENLISPCGACRQRIQEFASNNCQIHLANTSGIKTTYTFNELLPHSFKEF